MTNQVIFLEGSTLRELRCAPLNVYIVDSLRSRYAPRMIIFNYGVTSICLLVTNPFTPANHATCYSTVIFGVFGMILVIKGRTRGWAEIQGNVGKRARESLIPLPRQQWDIPNLYYIQHRQ